jgi:Ycf66 protein N-terminus
VFYKMLAYILAVLVGTGSVGLYIAAFFLPEIHRKHDFIWSGVGFFYALMLWIYARQIAGGILVGQTASVALLGWFAWQTLKLRRQLVPVNQQTPLPTKTQLQAQLGLKASPQTSVNPAPKTPTKPQAPTTNPQTIPNAQPSTITEVANVNVNIPPRASITPPTTIAHSAIEDATSEDDEAWIKLEIKPSPTASTRIGEATQPSAPPPPTATETSHIPVELDSEHEG